MRGPFASRIFGLRPRDGADPIYTPLFIPSISSTVDADWRRLAAGLGRGAAARGIVLVSAFDLAEDRNSVGPKAARAGSRKPRGARAAASHRSPTRLAGFRGVVLDSGGYEARKLRARWPRARFEEVASRFRADIVVGFDPAEVADDPERQVRDQIRFLAGRRKGTLRTLLLHMDPADLDVEAFVRRVLLPHARSFDILGLTEKDLGPSFPGRVRGILALRRAMDAASLVCPLHLFGTDDPLSLVVYAAAGVDIFDGLGWSTEFVDARTMSRHDLGHGPLCARWRAFALENGLADPERDAVLDLTFEWNVREITSLMAEVRRGVLHDEEEVLLALCRRAGELPADDLFEEMRHGR